MSTTASVTAIVVALLGAGILTFLRDGLKALRLRRRAATPAGRDALYLETADKSLLVVAKARDELGEDNARLRLSIVEERSRHAEDRAQWARDKAVLRGEIDALEGKLRALLNEVSALRTRTIV